MSTSETDPPAEPDEDDTGEDEDETTEEDDNDDQPEASSFEAPQLAPAAQTEKEIDKQRKALKAEAERHAGRINAILGEDALGLVQCEACPEGTPGWHYPANVFPEGTTEHSLYTMLAGDSGAEHKQPAYFTTCDECNGWCNVRTGAQFGTMTYEIGCPKCKSAGYIDLRADQPAPGPVLAPVNGSAAAPTVEPAAVTDMWGRPPGAPTYGKLPIFLTPDERAADLQAGYNLG